MNPRRNGNVKRDGDEVQASAPIFQAGDVVAITQAALRLGRLEMMGCRLLYRIGWPNEFLVKGTFENQEDGHCVFLWPCCSAPPKIIGLVDRDKGGQPRCGGHPAIYFEKVDMVRTPKKGDKRASALLPIIGEVFGFEYRDDEENPEFVTRILGLGASFTGPFAQLLKKIAEDNKIL